MLRRLLACLVLLTGLTAVGTPAHAGLAAMLGVQVEQAQRDDNSPGRTNEATCADRQRQQQARGNKVPECRPGRTITIVIPTVQMGSDRSFE